MNLNYWKKRIETFSTLEIRTDFSRPPVYSYDGHFVHHSISSEILPKLHEFNSTYSYSFLDISFSAYIFLLSRFCLQKDICLGVANCSSSSKETSPFSSYLPISVSLDNHDNPLEFMKYCSDIISESFEHQIPFPSLLESLNLSIDTDSKPLFQVTLELEEDLEDSKDSSFPEKNCHFKSLPIANSKFIFDFSLRIIKFQNSIRCIWIYASDLFKHETIEMLHSRFVSILSSLLSSPEKLSSITLQNYEEENQVASLGTMHMYNYQGIQTLKELFEKQVQSTPNNMCVEFHRIKMTYKEVDLMCNRIARCLHFYGCKPGSEMVLICTERCEWLPLFILAIYKAGGAYVPLSLEWPEQRISFVVNDTGARLCLCTRQGQMHLGQMNLNISLINENDFKDFSTESLPTFHHGMDAAYILYTSGSTGMPKGAIVINRGVIHWLQSHFLKVRPEPYEPIRRLHATQNVFDILVEEMWAAFSTGGAFCLVRGNITEILSDLTYAVKKNQTSWVYLTPSQLTAVDSLPEKVDIFTAGEALPYTLLKQWAHYPRRYFNLYGPIETSVNQAGWRVDPYMRYPTSIGPPHATCSIFILDEDLHIVPHGFVGELYIGGNQLGRGYLNRPELTASKFISDPFVHLRPFPLNEDRFYQSGDLCRWLSDGTIDFLGRKDFQVKLRGQRIELGEIESSILSISNSITRTVVIVHKNSINQQILVSYIEQNDAQDPFSSNDIRSFLSSKLPRYMVPSIIMMVQKMPINTSGKIDRKKLPPPIEEEKKEIVEPRNELERSLLKIVLPLMDLKELSVVDDLSFFGFTSLTAIRMLTSIKDTHNVNVAAGILLNNPSIENMAQAVQKELDLIQEEPVQKDDFKLEINTETNISMEKIKSENENHEDNNKDNSFKEKTLKIQDKPLIEENRKIEFGSESNIKSDEKINFENNQKAERYSHDQTQTNNDRS